MLVCADLLVLLVAAGVWLLRPGLPQRAAGAISRELVENIGEIHAWQYRVEEAFDRMRRSGSDLALSPQAYVLGALSRIDPELQFHRLAARLLDDGGLAVPPPSFATRVWEEQGSEFTRMAPVDELETVRIAYHAIAGGHPDETELWFGFWAAEALAKRRPVVWE